MLQIFGEGSFVPVVIVIVFFTINLVDSLRYIWSDAESQALTTNQEDEDVCHVFIGRHVVRRFHRSQR